LLAIVEFSMAMVVLITAGLLINSFYHLTDQDPGYDPEGVLAARINLPRARYQQANMHLAFYDRLLEEARAIPGVHSLGLANMMPMGNVDIRLGFQIPGYQPETAEDSPQAGVRAVSPGYFEAMAIPIVVGRSFSREDRQGGKQVVIVNEALVRRYFPEENPVGRQIEVRRSGEWLTGLREIVGVSHDVKPQGLDSEPTPEFFLPFQQASGMLMRGGPFSGMNMVVRTSGDPLALVPAIRSRVLSIDPQLPIFNISTLEQRLSNSVARPRFYATLLGVFAGLALLLAVVGIYGVLSYHVVQCTREIGVRMAMGAQRDDVLKLVIRQGAALALIGIVIGLVAGIWTSNHFLPSLLFGITATDSMTYIVIAAVMFIIAIVAAYIPARRAMEIDPVVALRYE